VIKKRTVENRQKTIPAAREAGSILMVDDLTKFGYLAVEIYFRINGDQTSNRYIKKQAQQSAKGSLRLFLTLGTSSL